MPFIATPELRIHYETAGAGETVVVLLHGNFASWRWWIPTLQNAPEHYCFYAPDLRGCGDTEQAATGYTIEQLSADLHQFAQALKLSKFHLVGHSLGGAVALQFTLDYPELVQTLSLIAPSPAEGLPHLRPEQTHFFSATRLADVEEFHTFLRNFDMNRSMLRRALKRMLPSIDPEEHTLLALLDDAARLPPQAIVGFFRTLTTWDVQARLAEIQQPVLILWGDLDGIVAREALERTVKGLAQGKWVIWQGVGHTPQLERPAKFNQLLFQFVENNTVIIDNAVSEPILEKMGGVSSWIKKLWERLKRR